MQLITTRNKEISFVELKKAISSGNGLELIRPGDKFAIELKNGEHVNAVCGGYVNEKRTRFVLEDCLADKWRMNDTPTNKGGYLKSEGRRHVLEDILPLFPDEIPSAAENAENLEEAICCFIDYGEYSVSGIMREVRAAYKEAEL